MLGRRTPRSRFDQALSWLWPRRGMGAALRYLKKRLVRIKGSPHAIAAGVACGAAVSFLPLPGLHFVLGGIAALAIRGSLIASAVGTVIGNPWTFPLIWIGSYRLGRWLGFGEGRAIAEASIGDRLKLVMEDVWAGRIAEAAVESWPVLGPTFVGGAIIGGVVGLIFYMCFRNVIAVYQTRRRAKLAAKRALSRRAPLIDGAAEGEA